VGLRGAGSILMSGSTAASQLLSLLFAAEVLPVCITWAVRQGGHTGPQQL